MREIKFRAWHPTEEKLHYFDWKSPETALSVGRLYSFRDLILEQCTGLKDKNGVEIYEGDIVTFGEMQHAKKKLRCAAIRFVYGGFGIEDGNMFFNFTPGFQFNRLLVIGNIHETPELLGGSGQ